MSASFKNQNAYWLPNYITSKEPHPSAFLLADYLEILDLLEAYFTPLKISASFQPALARQLQMLQSHQPSQLKLYRDTLDLLRRGIFKELPRQIDTLTTFNHNLMEKMGQQWVAILEKAKAEGAFLVEFLPLEAWINEEELEAVPLSAADQAKIINCRTLLESLKQSAVLTEHQYQTALLGLGNERYLELSDSLPQLNDPIYLMGGTASVLASANMLTKICQYFQVTIDYTYLDEARRAVSIDERRAYLTARLTDLIERVRDGLERHTYSTITLTDSKMDTRLEHEINVTLDLLVVFDLLRFESQIDDNIDVIWIDDRFFNQYPHRDGIQIITITEVLDALLAVGQLSQDDYYDKLLQLRKANTRYIPVTSEEIVYWLKQAPILDGCIKETEALTVLRQYIASCLLDTHRLQLPRMSDNSQNFQDESSFLLNFLHAIQDAMISGWLDDSVSNENATIHANWILINLYTGIFGTLHLTPNNNSSANIVSLVGLDISGLYISGIQFWRERDQDNLETKNIRQNYFKWLDWQLTERRFKADPETIIASAASIHFLLSEQRNVHQDADPQDQIARYMHQQLYCDLPDSICTEIQSDLDLMDWLGMKTVPSIKINTVSFPAKEFWQAAELAINGETASLNALEPKTKVNIQQVVATGSRNFLEIKSQDGSITYEIDDDLFGLASNKQSQVVEILKSHRIWMDCDSETLDRFIGEITSIKEPQIRFEKAKAWRDQSAAFFYEKLAMKLDHADKFDLSQLMPPSIEGLLRHFRMAETIGTDDIFHSYLDRAAQSLITEEGFGEALNRLSCLPVKLPSIVLKELTKMTSNDRQTLFKKLANSWASPICKLHLIDLVLNFHQEVEGELINFLLDGIYNDAAIPHFNLFGILLQLINNAFSFRSDLKECSAPIRLAMIWAHASKLQNLLDIPGLKLQKFIEDLWKLLQNQVNPEQFDRNPELWNDVLHPYRFDRIVVAVHGLTSLLKDQSSEVLIQAGVIERIQSFTVNTIENHRVPNPQLFRDTMLARDGLGSILGGDRGDCLAPIIGSDLAQYLQSESLKSTVEGAIQKLKRDPTDLVQWKWLNAIVGDLPVYDDSRYSLKQIIVEVNISGWFGINPDLSLLALDISSSQVNNVDDEKVRICLENQLLSLITLLANKTLDNINENVISQVIESIFRLSIHPGNSYRTSQCMADLMIKVVTIWPKLADTYLYESLFKLIRELPIEQSHGLWKAFLHLRALRSQQI